MIASLSGTKVAMMYQQGMLSPGKDKFCTIIFGVAREFRRLKVSVELSGGNGW